MKNFFRILSIALLALTACKKEPATPDLHVAENIIGKWMKSDQNGLPLPTDRKMVYTFISPTKAYMSASIDASPEVGTHWIDQLEADVTITGNKVSLTSHSEEGATMVVDFDITAISGTEFTANHKVTITLNGAEVYVVEDILRFEKVTADFAKAVSGTWEGRCTGEGSVFDDGQLHRWEYKEDGTYVYYRKENNNWKSSANTLNEYFVDGNLLCTRWVENGVENREWWEITVDGDTMNWTALRRNADGTTGTATFQMSKATTDDVRLIERYSETINSTTGKVLITVNASCVWENGNIQTLTTATKMALTGTGTETTQSYVYSGSDCTEIHFSSNTSNTVHYFTYADGRMTTAVKKVGGEITDQATIHAYTDDGYVQSMTIQDLKSGRTVDYELTWENGDLVSYRKHTLEPVDEEVIITTTYDDYPNAYGCRPLADHVFDLAEMTARASRHNCISESCQYTYANGRLIVEEKGTIAVYLTYSDGTTGRK